MNPVSKTLNNLESNIVLQFCLIFKLISFILCAEPIKLRFNLFKFNGEKDLFFADKYKPSALNKTANLWLFAI